MSIILFNKSVFLCDVVAQGNAIRDWRIPILYFCSVSLGFDSSYPFDKFHLTSRKSYFRLCIPKKDVVISLLRLD